MLVQTAGEPRATIESVLQEFLSGVVTALPRLLAGLVFLSVAYVSIRLILAVTQRVLAGVVVQPAGVRAATGDDRVRRLALVPPTVVE